MLKLLTYVDTPAVLAYLNRHPIEAAFLLGNVIAYGVENRLQEGRNGDYFGYYRGPDLCGIISFYNLGSCILHYEHEAAIDEFGALMQKRNFRIALGFRSIMTPITGYLAGRKDIREIVQCEYMLCRQFQPFILSGATFKTMAELGENRVLDFMASAYRREWNRFNNRTELLRLLSEHCGTEEFLFLVVKNDIKAQAYIQTTTPQVAQIGGIYTSKEQRGRGYSKAIASEFCRRIIQKGGTPSLIVKQDNLPAKRAYEYIGFTYFSDYQIIRF